MPRTACQRSRNASHAARAASLSPRVRWARASTALNYAEGISFHARVARIPEVPRPGVSYVALDQKGAALERGRSKECGFGELPGKRLRHLSRHNLPCFLVRRLGNVC